MSPNSKAKVTDGAYADLMRRLIARLIRPAELVDLDPRDTPPPPDPSPTLLRVAAEALILSDEAASVIRRIRAREGLGFVAPRAGPLVRRFFALRDQLPPTCPELRDEQVRGRLDAVLHHHAMLLSIAMDLLAFEWRSERLSRQLDALEGMGEPAVLLEEIYADLASRRDISANTSGAVVLQPRS